MANHSATKKAIRQNIKRKLRNNSIKSNLKTLVKKVLTFVEQKDMENAKSSFIEAQSAIARAMNKTILKKNTASRKVSNLSKKVKSLAV
ncbi:MAG TPA: 30S ribosomal protein S20 [Candidatus Megaira endosymbiont of Hartmannula sinica]|nr:30S ribosomal protein S20 [Candidatus Megaera endosymbiont of Hartmannula sinica]